MEVNCIGCNEFSYAMAAHKIAVSNEFGVVKALQRVANNVNKI